MIPENMKWVLDNIYTDIAEFMDEPLECVMAKCQRAQYRVYKLWENFGNPATREERDDFYKYSLCHLHEGANWHNDPNAKRDRFKIAELCEGRVLDYGCGIATEAFYAALMGHDVELYDIGGIKYFLKWRIKKYGLENISVIDRIKYSCYDSLVSIDCLEHLENPAVMVSMFRLALKDNGLLLIEAPFNELEPKGHLAQNANLNLAEMIERAGIKRWRTNLIR